MSQDLASLYIKVDSTGVITASKNLDDFHKTAGKTEVAAKKVTTATASMVAGWVSVAAITATVISVMKQSVQAFMDAEKAELKMAMALKNQGQYSREAMEELKRYTAELQKTTMIEDDLALSVMATLKAFGMSNAEMIRAMRIAADMSAATGKSIEDTAQAVALAYAGQARALRQYGVVIEEGTEKTEIFNQALLQLEKRYGESAQAQLLTYTGQWAKMKNQWSDIAEFLGWVFLKLLQMINIDVGILTTAFLWMGDKVLAVLNILLKPLFKILETVGWIADKLGLKGVSLVMEGITTSIDNARGAVQAAKSDTVAWTKANFENLKSFNKIDDAVSKMKPGQRTKPDFGEGATRKASAKSSKDTQEDLRAELGLLLNVEDAYYATEQAIQAMADAGDEAAEAVKKLLAEDYAKAMAGINADSQSDYQNRIDAIIAEEKKRFDAIDLMRITDQENEKQYLADKAKAHEVAEEKIAKLEYERFQERTDMIASSFGQLQSAFSAIAKTYDEGSSASKRWEEAARTMEIAQRAVAVVQAVAAIATQGLGDPYTAFARIAAMAATMGALLASIGESVNGGSGGSSTSSKKSTSTALGSDEQSQSVSKSYELLKDTYDMQNSRLTALYNQMKDLNQNITGLVASILKTGGMYDFSAYKSSFSSSRSASGLGIAISQGIGLASADPFTTTTHQILENVFGNALGNNISKALFGGTTKKITQQGFALGDYYYGDTLDVQNWAKIKTVKDGGWFGSDKTSYADKTTALTAEQEEVGRLFNTMYSNISGALVELSKGLGTDIEAALGYSFEAATINLKGMTAEEMTTAINEYFSTIGDEAVDALFGEVITKYQKVNEGLLETAVRLVQDKEIVLDYMEKVNKAFVGSTENAIAFSEALISAAGDLDALTSAIDTYYDKFFSDAEKQANTTKEMTEAMAAYGYSLPKTREAFRAIVESIDAVADPQKYYDIVKLAGDMDTMFTYLEDAADAAAEAAEEALEKMKDALRAEIELKKDAYTESFNLQKDAMQKELSILTGYYEKLKSARESMQINDAQSQGMIFSTAKFQLSKLLREVRGGKLSGIETADDMLKTLTSISPEQYSTRTEYLKDYNNIYNSISEMEKITGSKKDAQQQQIDLLQATYDMQMEAFQDQIDAIDNQTIATKQLGNVVWSACGYLAAYQAGKITLAQLMAVSSPDYATANALPHYAAGGTGSGWSLVGERGAELANLGTGSRVYSNSDTKAIFNSEGIIKAINNLSDKVDKQEKNNRQFKEDVTKTLKRLDAIGILTRAA